MPDPFLIDSPTPTPRDLGCASNAEVIAQFMDLNGKRVIDVGCGGLAFTREIAKLGAQVLAIDPDVAQAEINDSQDIPENIEFQLAGAEKLPVQDSSVDGVFFSYSLHHVPAALYPDAFAEVARVLRPDGFLYVIEPTGCKLNDVMRLFHDEEAERAAAQEALVRLAAPSFCSCDIVTYHSYRCFDSFEHFVKEFSNRTFNSGYTVADVERQEVRELFERNGAPDFRFVAPKIVHCFQGLRN